MTPGVLELRRAMRSSWASPYVGGGLWVPWGSDVTWCQNQMHEGSQDLHQQNSLQFTLGNPRNLPRLALGALLLPGKGKPHREGYLTHATMPSWCWTPWHPRQSQTQAALPDPQALDLREGPPSPGPKQAVVGELPPAGQHWESFPEAREATAALKQVP